MWLRKLQGMDLEKNLAKHVSTVVKKVTLFKTEIVQLEVERVVAAVNMVIMLIIAKGEEAQSRETKHHPTTRRRTATPCSRKTSQICGGSF